MTNPNPNVELVAATYMATELFLYDVSRLTLKSSILSECDVLVASLDRRTLAGGDSSGRIQLFDFESLHLLTQISLPNYSVRAMRFSNNSLRLFDLRDFECNVSAISDLVRKLWRTPIAYLVPLLQLYL